MKIIVIETSNASIQSKIAKNIKILTNPETQ
jgi:hypothetical protein